MTGSGLGKVAITTAGSPDAALCRKGEAVAHRFGVPFVQRGGRSLEALRAAIAADVLVVFGRDGVRLYDGNAPVVWSPGMAALRIGRMEAGGVDPLVEVAGLRRGDQVLDATLGLGQDTLVASRAVGESGRIVALEKSLPLAIFTAAGLAGAERGGAIEVLHGDAARYLSSQPDRSVDVVLFDPMFARPRKSQPAFEMLRRHADAAPLTPEVLDEAKRVARRSVVVKGAKYSDDLRKLGLRPLPRSRHADVVWARIDV
ncbi:MAG: class I SAM-dependent methyltransferase [Myxococcaceae bacterium]|nr:class I SAM-dependent methyltransferase [Myxococcaceae bacterium]